MALFRGVKFVSLNNAVTKINGVGQASPRMKRDGQAQMQ